MKHTFFLVLGLAFIPVSAAHAQTKATNTGTQHAHYSNVWRPITTQGIRDGIHLNRNNGVGLEQIMARALLQQKALDYLLAVQAESKAQPKNATLLAAYAWALANVRNSYVFDHPGPMPSRLSSRFNFDWQYIRDTLQQAKELDSHCWLAFIAEATLNPGGPPPTQEAAATYQAFQIQRNPVTLTRYGSALMFQSAGQKDIAGIKEGQRLLFLAERLYPTYYKSSYQVYESYLYPSLDSKQKSLEALRRYYNNIPPEYRHASWVVRYFKYLGLKQDMRRIGVTL